MSGGIPVPTPLAEVSGNSSSNSTAGEGSNSLLPLIVSLPTSLFLVALVVAIVLVVVLACSSQAQRKGRGGEEEGEAKDSAESERSPAPQNKRKSLFCMPLPLQRFTRKGSTGMRARDLSKSQLSSHGSLSSLAKLEHQPHRMQLNPTYSASNLSIYGAVLEPDAEPDADEIEPYDIHSYCGQMDCSMVHDFLQSYTSVYDKPLVALTCNLPLEVTEKNVREVRLLGVGQFGRAVLAETVGLSLKGTRLTDVDKGVSIRVAVKKLKPNAEAEVHEAFQREIKVMSGLDHESIVRLLAICTSGTPFIIMEYMENGDLNQYLRKRQLAPTTGASNQFQLTVPTLLFMALQIGSGMEYLASLRFVHRDLASRNCLVGQRYTVKIADFGMSRSLYASNYFRLKGRAVLPIRWMASECFYGQFSEKTDVWAFGVTMWEIFELAKKQPFEGMTNAEVVDNAMKGSERRLLPRPQCCPTEIYEVMLSCWECSPEERAGFQAIHSSLAQLYTQQSL